MILTYIRCSLLLTFMLGSLSGIQAQTYNIATDNSITTCDGILHDSGGQNGNYGDNEDHSITICSTDPVNTHIQLSFQTLQLGDGDTLKFFNGPTADPATLIAERASELNGILTTIQTSAGNPGGCLTVTFQSDGSSNGPGWRAFIDCIPSCQRIEAVLVSSTPVAVDGYIDVCPGRPITLTGAGNYPEDGVSYNHSDANSSFEWDFNDGTQAVGPTVIHTYDEPGGYIVRLTITDLASCTSVPPLTLKVRVAPPPIWELLTDPDVVYCATDTITLTAAVNVPDTLQTNSFDLLAASTFGSFQTGLTLSDTIGLPDGNGDLYTTSLEFFDFTPGAVVNGPEDIVSICVNMEHSYAWDLEVFIECPNGQQLELQEFMQTGGEVLLGEPIDNSPDNSQFGVGYDYCWTPEADFTWREYNAMFGGDLPAGDYAATESWEDLAGCPLNGEWSINVRDSWPSDDGWLFQWSINFAPELYPALEIFTNGVDSFYWSDNQNFVYYSPDSIVAQPNFAGDAAFNFNIVDSFGCVFDTTVAYQVLPFSHPDCYNCRDIVEVPFQQDTLCPGNSFAAIAVGPENQDTTVAFQAYVEEPFGWAQYPPNNPYRPTIEVNSIRPTVMNDVVGQLESVCVDIETNFDADIRLFLIAPNGTSIELSTGNGGGGDNYTNTCFTPTATVPITAGTPPFTGNFLPEGNFNDLVGTPINGTWTLRASDDFAPLPVGLFRSWEITFRTYNEITYTWDNTTDLSCQGCPDPVITPSAPGAYTYTADVTDNFGCMESAQIDLIVPDSFSQVAVNCTSIFGAGELIFSWLDNGPAGLYTYQVTQGGIPGPVVGPVSDTSVVLTNLTVGEEVFITVTPVITDPLLLSCTSPEPVTTSCTYQECVFTAEITAVNPTSCGNSLDGSIEVTWANTQGETIFELNGEVVPTTTSLTGLSVGDYQLLIRDESGCGNLLMFTIVTPDPIELSLVELVDVTCNGGNNGSIQLTATGGSGNYEYSFDGGASFSANPLSSGLTAISYNISVRDDNGCQTDTTFSVTEPEALVLTGTSSPTSCFNTLDGEISLTASGGTGAYTYTWSILGSGAGSVNLPPGSYGITVTDENMCSQTTTVAIDSPPAIETTLTASEPTRCFGGSNGSLTVTATGGTGELSYAWDDENSQVNNNAVFLAAGTYNLITTDINGCADTLAADVLQPDSLEIQFLPQDVACRGESTGSAQATVSGGTPDYTFDWQTDETTALATDLPAGTFGLEVTDANGCTVLDSVRIAEPATGIELAAQQDQSGCFNTATNVATVNPQGGTGSYSYTWTSGETTATATQLPAGPATVSVTDAGNCTVTIDLDVVQLDSITFNLIATAPTCQGLADGRLGVTQVMGGAALTETDYNYSWSTSQSGIVINNLAGGTGYGVTVTDQRGCRGTGMRNLPDPAPVVFAAESTPVRCFGESNGSLQIVQISGPNAGAYSIQWNAGAGNVTDSLASGLPAGTFSVQVTDAAGCSRTESFTVEQPTQLTSGLSSRDNRCFGDSNGSITAEVSGGVPAYTYAWSTSDSTQQLTDVPAGDYQLTVTDANGCRRENRVTVTEPEPVTVSSLPRDVVCQGDFTGRISALAEGGRRPYSYSLDGTSFTRDTDFLGLDAGTYTIYVRDAGNCIYTAQTQIGDGPRFDLDLGEDREITFGDSIVLIPEIVDTVGGIIYQWMGSYDGTIDCDSCATPTVKPDFEIDYTLVVINADGCEAEDRVRVSVNKFRVVEVPTGFTPNGDGQNDLLIVHGRPGTRIGYLQVFDRWGEMVYEDRDLDVNDFTRGWDGTNKGKPLNGGVFIWQAEAIYEDGSTEIVNGQTTLLR